MMSIELPRVAGQVINDVVIGNNEHLFLAQGGHRCLDYALGRLSVREEIIEGFWSNVFSRKALCEDIRAKYVHLIVPDKHSVLTEEFPFEQTQNLTDVYLRKNTLRPFVFDGRDALKNDPKTYLRTDTHLTDFGSVTLALALSNHLKFQVPQSLADKMLNSFAEMRIHTGDLGNKFSPQISSLESFTDFHGKSVWLHNGVAGPNNGIIDIRVNLNAINNERVLVFGDSFGREIARFLTLLTKHVMFIRTPFFHKEIAKAFQADVVITQNAERYLENCQIDDSRDFILLSPLLRAAQYLPSAAFVTALQAELSYPRQPFIEWIDILERNNSILESEY